MKNKKIRWGILGCGRIAHKFASDLRTVDSAVLQAVASKDENRANTFGETHNATTCYDNYQALVSNPEIDVIYIATPHTFHFEHTLLCLKHKKAVLCEKPMGISIAQVQQMIHLAEQNEVFLMEALWTAFLPHYQFVKELIVSKKYGEILEITADFGINVAFDTENRLYNKELGGGSLLDIGIYPIFLALDLLGVPKEISAKATIGKTVIDEDCEVELEHNNKVTSKLFSSIKKKTATEAIIKLERAEIMINGRFHEPSSVTVTEGNKYETFNFPVETFGYNFEIEHVNKMLQQGNKESDIMPLSKSLELITTLDTIRKRINLEY